MHDKLTYTIGNRRGLVDSSNFTLKYTVARSDSKDIKIVYVSDFTGLIDEVTAMKSAAFKLVIVERKASAISSE